jgi:hypothetical protein
VVCVGGRECFPDHDGRPTCKCNPECPHLQRRDRLRRLFDNKHRSPRPYQSQQQFGLEQDTRTSAYSSSRDARYDDYDGVVCGSDDRTHTSACALKFRACRVSQDIRVVARGPCQPPSPSQGIQTLTGNFNTQDRCYLNPVEYLCVHV